MTTLPQPPVDLNRTERKAFRKLAQTVADRGIDPVARASLIAQAVRVEARIPFLQAAEREAETGQKMSAMRGYNTAMLELRRINVEIFRGAAKVDAAVPVEIAAAASLDAADEAWRQHYWHSEPLGMTDDTPEFKARLDRYNRRDADLRSRFGPPTMAALLYRTRAEEIWTTRLLDKHRPRCIPDGEIQAIYRSLGFVAGPFDPRSYRARKTSD